MDTDNSAWLEVQQWLREATNEVEILAGDRERGKVVLQQLGVSPRSLMGTLALETGGVLFDHGWIRFLGSGCERMTGSLLSWNSVKEGYGLRNAFIVAYDVAGGFFAMNGGAFAREKGAIFYLEPDTLRWKNLEGSYSQLFSWAASGDLHTFYENMRWPGWEQEIVSLPGDQGMFIYPFLFTEKGLPLSGRSRKPVPMRELWNLQLDLAQQLKNHPEGTPFVIHFTDAYEGER